MNNIIGVDRLDKNKRILLGYGICKECKGETRITSPFIKPSKVFYFSKRYQCLGVCKKLWLFEEDKIYGEENKETQEQAPSLFD